MEMKDYSEILKRHQHEDYGSTVHSGVEYKSGKAMRMSKEEMQNLKKDIQQFQQRDFPELSNSVVNHDKKQKSISGEKEYQLKYRSGRETEKEKVMGIIKACYKKANSKKDFFRLLSESGLKTYERGGRITGVVHDKYKFRLQRIGFSKAILEELDKTHHREKELSKSRAQDINRNFQKER